MYDQLLSLVAPGILVSGASAARNLDLLRSSGVTHIINCAATLCPNHYPENFRYLSLPLADSLREDISFAFYDAIDFILEAQAVGGSVLIHCMHGVSRSASIAIAYIIWSQACSYEDAFASVRNSRPTINPNIGSACALLAWQASVVDVRSRKLEVWAVLPYTRILTSQGESTYGDEVLDCLRGRWKFLPLTVDETSRGGEALAAARASAAAAVGSSFHGSECQFPLIFLNWPLAAIYLPALDVGVEDERLISVVSRLRRYHKLPAESVPMRVFSGRESTAFWKVLGSTQHPSAPSTPPSKAGLRQLQAQAASLQHVLMELSTALESFFFTRDHLGATADNSCVPMEGIVTDVTKSDSCGPMEGTANEMQTWHPRASPVRRRLSDPVTLAYHTEDEDPRQRFRKSGILHLTKTFLTQPIALDSSAKAHSELLAILKALTRELPRGTPLGELVPFIETFATQLQLSAIEIQRLHGIDFGDGAELHGRGHIDDSSQAPPATLPTIDEETLIEAEERLLAQIHDIESCVKG